MKYQRARRLHQSRSASRNRQGLNSRATKSELSFANALDKAGVKYIQNFTVRTAESFSGYYLVDFYLPRHKLLVEIDGGVHRSESRKWKDRLRTEAIERAMPSATLVRLWNSEVDKDPAKALAKILDT